MAKETEGLTPEENLRAETEILKLKLETEGGAKIYNVDDIKLPPEVENEWYNHIYNYESLCKEAGNASVYEFIEKPDYKKIEELHPEEIENALYYLLNYMYEKGVALDFDEEDYTAETIYKFVTEELFVQEVNCYKAPGAYKMFDYEDFYPNHEKNLKRYSNEYLDTLFGKAKWHPEFLHFTHEEEVNFNGAQLLLNDYSNKIIELQLNRFNFLVSKWQIEEVHFNLEEAIGSVKGNYYMTGKGRQNFSIAFKYSYDMWTISGVTLKF